MTDTVILLTDEGKRNLIHITMIKARQQNQNLTKDKIHIGIKHHYIYKPSWTETFEIFWSGTPEVNPKNIDIDIKEQGEKTLNITSNKPEFDKPAIWISQQLDRAYPKINVQINTPELTNTEGTWKCSHCGTVVRSSFLSCPICGANKP